MFGQVMLLCSLVICVSVIIANYVIKKDERLNVIISDYTYNRTPTPDPEYNRTLTPCNNPVKS